MRTYMAVIVSAVAVAALATVTTPVAAQGFGQYPWCSQYGTAGAESCSYNTYAQCMDTISGIGGYCYQNPAYGYVRRR
jgi:hypothetical protein